MGDGSRSEGASQQDRDDATQTRTWVEEVEIAGNQLIDRIEELVREGNAKRVIIRTSDGNELMTIPLTLGVAAGGLITLAAPLLAALGAMAGLVSRLTLDIERDAPPTPEEHGPATPATRASEDATRQEGQVAR